MMTSKTVMSMPPRAACFDAATKSGYGPAGG